MPSSIWKTDRPGGHPGGYPDGHLGGHPAGRPPVLNVEPPAYLTFDDGPTERTLMLSEMLSERSMTATFFLLGSNVESKRELVHELMGRGHTIGLHGFDHESAWSTSPASTSADIRKGHGVLSSATQTQVRWYRPPFGRVTPWGLTAARKLGMKTVLWTVNPLDYKATSSALSVTEHVRTWVRPGSVVLLHEGGPVWNNFDLDMPLFLDSLRDLPVNFKRLP